MDFVKEVQPPVAPSPREQATMQLIAELDLNLLAVQSQRLKPCLEREEAMAAIRGFLRTAGHSHGSQSGHNPLATEELPTGQ
jgi:hypothetical protein